MSCDQRLSQLVSDLADLTRQAKDDQAPLARIKVLDTLDDILRRKQMYNSGCSDPGHVVHRGLRTYCINQADPSLLDSNLVPNLVPPFNIGPCNSRYMDRQRSLHPTLWQCSSPVCQFRALSL